METKEKVLLVVGCSHAAGAEINGIFESKYNREHSFGNVLANKLGYRPVNLGSSGATNATISRTVIEWIERFYNPTTMELFVLCAWTESTRIEVPVENPVWYHEPDTYSDYKSKTYHLFHRLNLGINESDGFPKELLKYQKFMTENQTFLQIYTANLVLQIQYYLKSKNINYLMVNTMHMFDRNEYINFYLKQIDYKKYMNPLNNNSSFYWYYKNKGYENTKAEYWHHNEIPHNLYAEKMFNFLQ